MRSPTVPFDLTLSKFYNSQVQGYTNVEGLLSRKGAELGHILLLKTNR